MVPGLGRDSGIVSMWINQLSSALAKWCRSSAAKAVGVHSGSGVLTIGVLSGGLLESFCSLFPLWGKTMTKAVPLTPGSGMQACSLQQWLHYSVSR